MQSFVTQQAFLNQDWAELVDDFSYSAVRELFPYHPAEDEEKVSALVEFLEANGWGGAPLVVVDGGLLMTGSHRLEAAKEAGVTPECVDFEDLLEFFGTEFAGIDKVDFEEQETDIPLLSAMARKGNPGLAEYLGLDAH